MKGIAYKSKSGTGRSRVKKAKCNISPVCRRRHPISAAVVRCDDDHPKMSESGKCLNESIPCTEQTFPSFQCFSTSHATMTSSNLVSQHSPAVSESKEEEL